MLDAANPPNPGPIIIPSPAIPPRYPNMYDFSCRVVTSATYAWVTELFPPVTPSKILAKAITRMGTEIPNA